ncbi:Crp/Fnr family transcriptional regulator [Lachnospiraceae bacterium C1.1]|nr:Crp/Fnr family transcriptional regulator [Lachnospiraceae bacterium C1.1]
MNLQELIEATDVKDIKIEKKTYKKGESVHSPSDICEGLFMVDSGVLRVFIISPEGREITLYRLGKGELCLFSASCAFNAVSFDIFIEAADNCILERLSVGSYQKIKDHPLVAATVNETFAQRMQSVIGLVNDILWNSMDTRILNYLRSESELQKSKNLKITHETIANNLGTAREVVSRVLKYLEREGRLQLSRGEVTLLSDPD